MNYIKYIIFIASSLFIANSFVENSKEKQKCVYVGPGGVSGFWHAIKKLKNRENTQYYCASSGCLAIISKDLELHKIYNLANEAKMMYSFSNVKNSFIDSVTKNIKSVPNITIATMDKFLRCNYHVPKDKKELKRLLILTTDVPFLSDTNYYTFDGGLCFYFYNPCKESIKLPIRYKFIKTLLSYDLSIDELRYFYNY